MGMTTRRKKPARLNSRSADRHALYEVAVQQPEVMIGFIEELGPIVMGRPPRLLREDFCGTAQLASHWVASQADRQAIGVDLDPAVLQWAEQHNRDPLGEAAGRLTLLQEDVRRCHAGPADVLVSLNFSHFIYQQRGELAAYLCHARRCIADDGLIILDAFGGPGSITPGMDRRKFSSFDYFWEQACFDPLTNGILCHIHFRFPDGSMMRRAFTYDWRMWSLPELRELLEEAGFGPVEVYFEAEDGFIADIDAVDQEAWVAYIVASARGLSDTQEEE
jgi:hypothetical protein